MACVIDKASASLVAKRSVAENVSVKVEEQQVMAASLLLRDRSSTDHKSHLGVRDPVISKKRLPLPKTQSTKTEAQAKTRPASDATLATTFSDSSNPRLQGENRKDAEARSASSCLDECVNGTVEADDGHRLRDGTGRCGAVAEGGVAPEMLDGCDISSWPDFSFDHQGAGEIDDLDVPGSLMLPEPEEAGLERPSATGGVSEKVTQEGPADTGPIDTCPEADVTDCPRPSETYRSDSQLNDLSELTSKDSSTQSAQKKKTKVDWTPELHRRFVHAVEQLGVEKAIPSRILDLMGVKSLTRHNIASHLQKYRSHRRHLAARDAEAANWSSSSGSNCTRSSPAEQPANVWGPSPGKVAAASAPAPAPVPAWPAPGMPSPHAGGMPSHPGMLQGHPMMGVMSHHAPPLPGAFPQPYPSMPGMPHPSQMHLPQAAPPLMMGAVHPSAPAMGMPVWGHPSGGAAGPAGAGPPRQHMWVPQQPQHVAYPPPTWLAVEGASPWHHFPGFPAGPPTMDAWPHPAITMSARGSPCFPRQQLMQQHHYSMMPAPHMVCGSPMYGQMQAAAAAAGMPMPAAAAAGLSMHMPSLSAPAGLPPPPYMHLHAGMAPGQHFNVGGMGGAAAAAGAAVAASAAAEEPVADESMPHPMFPISEDLSMDLAAISASFGTDFNETHDLLDAAITEALRHPSLPLPLGLKPPSLDGVMEELNRQGIRMPATGADAADAAAAAGDADGGSDGAGADGTADGVADGVADGADGGDVMCATVDVVGDGDESS